MSTYVDTDGNVWEYVDASLFNVDADYYAHYWGTCSLYTAYQEGKTKKNGCYWGGCNAALGTRCPNWKPLGVQNLDDLLKHSEAMSLRQKD